MLTKNCARRGTGVRWERENDAYYPRDKYRDIWEYFGTRYATQILYRCIALP
jgi:hypothetical protein